MWRNHGARMKKDAFDEERETVPDGYHTVTPYLACGHAAQAIAFYEKTLGAKELLRRLISSDKLSRGGSAVHLHVYMPNADKVVGRAVNAGARVVQPLEETLYGDRTDTVQDPFRR
jgi:PhnB protein